MLEKRFRLIFLVRYSVVNFILWLTLVQRFLYEIKRRSGWLQKKAPVQSWRQADKLITGNFFQKYNSLPYGPLPTDEAGRILAGTFSFFSKHSKKVGFVPSWFFNPFVKKEQAYSTGNKHWSKFNDFSKGDIKGVWELGRFAWASERW